MTGIIKSIQEVSVTLSGVASNTATISPVTTANAHCFFKGYTTNLTATNTGQNEACRVALTDSTTVTVTRGSTGGAITVVAVVIEYASGVNSIQQGTITISGTSGTATLGITPGPNAFLHLLGASVTSSGNSINHYSPTLTLSGAVVTATIGTAVPTGVLTVGYVCIDLDSTIIKSIQALNKTDATANTNYTDTINPVDTDNTFIS